MNDVACEHRHPPRTTLTFVGKASAPRASESVRALALLALYFFAAKHDPASLASTE